MATKQITAFLFFILILKFDIKAQPSIELKFDNEVVIAWNQLFFRLCMKNDGYRVTVATRVLAYSNWAAYEAIIPSTKYYQSLGKRDVIIELPKYYSTRKLNPFVAANNAYYLSFLHFFPNIDINQRKTIDSLDLFFENKYAISTDKEDVIESKKWAEVVTDSILKRANADGGANAYLQNKPLDYADKMPRGEGLWQRTFPDYLHALTPYWGEVKTILIQKDSVNFVPPIPYSIDTNSLFFNQAKEVYQLARNTNEEQLKISEFWSDDIQFFTPDIASHFVSIACQLIKKRNFDLEESSHLMTKLTIGLFDGSIICWKEKYQFNVVRPVTYIRNHIDSDWRTNLNDKFKGGLKNMGITPAHPSYPSGHSVFGAIAQVIFEDTFGKNYLFMDSTYIDKNDFKASPRILNDFEEMALENAYSRIYLGVHFRMDCEEGLRVGYQIGRDLKKTIP